MRPDIVGRSPTVWAVGGGKGGVGKSVIAANLGVALARLGHQVVLFDADLGGANLHTFFGMSNPPTGLGSFLSKNAENLNEISVELPIENLRLISGAGSGLETANLKYALKSKILRHLRRLEAEYVVVDIGAGSSFNVLDFFLAADQGILVVVPEPTSVENAYHFLKTAFYRALKDVEPKSRIRQILNRVRKELEERGIRSPRELLEQIAREDLEAGMALEERVESFRPGVLINRVQKPGDRRLGDDISLACRDYFGTDVEVLGALDYDPLVRESIVQRRPIMELFPGTAFGRGVMSLAERLLGSKGS